VVAETDGKARASLILGFFAWIIPAAIGAVILGHISRSEIQRSGGKLKGGGMALAGLIMGYGGLAMLPLMVIIIAAIAVPNLLRSRIVANQASAVGSLRTINTSAVTYASTFNRGYPESLAFLGPPTGGKAADANAADLIDEALASGRKSGYVFTYRVVAKDPDGLTCAYTINADPVQGCGTGNGNCYFTDETGMIRLDKVRPANKNSPLITG